jgi:hypothetical protein
MSDREKFENHALMLGKLLSIEMGARLALVKLDANLKSKVFTRLSHVKKCDQVEYNAFTNKNDLRQTLEQYNKRASNECKVDVTILVNLRDSLAHGRTFGFGNMDCLRILKFSRKQTDGKV